MLDIRRRNLAGRTGCGICGVDSLEAAMRPLPKLKAAVVPSVEAIRHALAALPAAQRIDGETHSVHAAAFAGLGGQVVMLREDVGRHNALDKLIGGMAHAGIDATAGFALITSRCSMEMVQKAVTMGSDPGRDFRSDHAGPKVTEIRPAADRARAGRQPDPL